MKTNSLKTHQRSGLITILSVVIIGSFLLAIMGIMYRGSIRSLDAQKKVQLQIDYDARKQAFLRSVVTMAPVTVANTMITDANANFSGASGLFDLASSASKLGSARSAADDTGMEFPSTYKNGNTGNKTGTFDVANYVASVTAASSPILSGNTVEFTKINYPGIHFGYYSVNSVTGAKTFIAKKNSWTINVHERASDLAAAGLSADLLTDNYDLDIYEIPAQLAISSSAFTNIGQIGTGNFDAGNSDNITIEGIVYAKKATMSHGTFDGVSTTQGAALSGATVGGYTADASGARTTHENADTTFYPISKASDYARTLFLPINSGFNFFDRFATSDENGVATEEWYTYTCGSHQCKMKLDIIEVIGGIPTALRFTIDTHQVVILSPTSAITSGVSWPGVGDAGYDDFPFLPEATSGNQGVAIHLGKLAQWITTPDGGGVSSFDTQDYNSIAINANYKDTSVSDGPIEPTALVSPLVVVIRDCDDLTSFFNGFSLVTNYTLLILEDLNQIPLTGGGDDYPPLSLFAPTIGYGLGDEFRTVSLTGSLGSLNRGTNEVNILELNDANGESSAAQTFADLKPIENIEDLPPINVMNWLVMIKKQ
jgi:hypothetical protein